jgi:hypothetical protein
MDFCFWIPVFPVLTEKHNVKWKKSFRRFYTRASIWENLPGLAVAYEKFFSMLNLVLSSQDRMKK